MLDKEKLWIAVYLNIGYMANDDILFYLDECYKALKYDESVRVLVIPIREEDSKVECVYDPKNENSEKYEEFFQKANEYIKNLTKD